jgi:hypothetical protein
MKYNLNALDPLEFERLCGALLVAQGWRVRRFGHLGERDYGIDFGAESKDDGTQWIIQARRFSLNRVPMSELRRALLDLNRALTVTGAQMALLMTSATVSAQVIDELPPAPNVLIWDADMLESILDREPQIKDQFVSFLKSKERFDTFAEQGVPSSGSSSDDLLKRLKTIPEGSGWQAYENICVEILNHIFIPPLRMPKIQSTSEDGLDRRDAIYPIGAGHPFWDNIKYQYSARMVVAEFKNHTEKIGQTEVESLQQYLMPEAKRSFGILCSRRGPSPSALKARRRAWMTSRNLILFLSDLDLEELLRKRDAGEDPSLVLDSQMDDFFITLAP